jgi:hypothetical protein
MPNGLLLAYHARGHFRDQRTASDATTPLYGESWAQADPVLYGLTPRYTTNMNPLNATPFTAGVVGGAGSPAKAVAIVGDFSQARFLMRRDITLRSSDTAVVGSHNAFEQNKLIVRWEMRCGFVINDRDKAFAKVVNAS